MLVERFERSLKGSFAWRRVNKSRSGGCSNSAVVGGAEMTSCAGVGVEQVEHNGNRIGSKFDRHRRVIVVNAFQ